MWPTEPALRSPVREKQEPEPPKGPVARAKRVSRREARGGRPRRVQGGTRKGKPKRGKAAQKNVSPQRKEES